jgi:hypothetical protein
MSAQKKLYLHIGYHKTGTSAIQRGLNENRHRLKRYGYYYPETGKEGNKQLFSYGDIAMMRQLRAEMDAAAQPNIIMSNEWFSKNTAEEIGVLGNYLTGIDPYIVVYLRRQDEYFQAWWTQHAKTGAFVKPFVEWIESFKPSMQVVAGGDEEAISALGKLPTPLLNANYYRYLGLWGETFGHDHILVRPYERSQLHPDILRDFLYTCGVPETVELENHTQQVNVSPSSKTVEVIRRIGAGFKTALPSATKEFPQYTAVFTLAQNRADEMGWNNTRLNYISSDLHKQIMTCFDPVNQAVAKKYLGRDWLFQDPYVEKPIQNFEIDELKADEAIEFIGPILGEMTHRAVNAQLNVDRRKRHIESYHATAALIHELPVPRIFLRLINKILLVLSDRAVNH